MKKTSAKSHRVLVKICGEHVLVEQTCPKWFALFKSGDFRLENEECAGWQRDIKMKQKEVVITATLNAK